MTADPARLTTARQLLTQLGLTIADLQCQDTPDRAVPALAEYLPQVIAAAGPGAKRTYGSKLDQDGDGLGRTGAGMRFPSPTSKLCNIRWSPPRGRGATAATAVTPAST